MNKKVLLYFSVCLATLLWNCFLDDLGPTPKTATKINTLYVSPSQQVGAGDTVTIRAEIIKGTDYVQDQFCLAWAVNQPAAPILSETDSTCLIRMPFVPCQVIVSCTSKVSLSPTDTHEVNIQVFDYLNPVIKWNGIEYSQVKLTNEPAVTVTMTKEYQKPADSLGYTLIGGIPGVVLLDTMTTAQSISTILVPQQMLGQYTFYARAYSRDANNIPVAGYDTLSFMVKSVVIITRKKQ